ARWLERFWASSNRRQRRFHKPLNILAMAAHYSPKKGSPHLGIEFPFDLETGEFRPEVWRRWREHDPVQMVEHFVGNLAKLRLVYIDCGTRDEFGLIWGARSLVARLRRAGLAPHYEEFEDGHMNIQYRYDTSLPLLARALEES